jgi:hypothetical protein
MQYLTANDAAILFSAFSATSSIIFMLLKTKPWPSWLKFLTACAWCGLGGYLKLQATDSFVGITSFIAMSSSIYISGYALYVGLFSALGLERVLYPKSALISDAKQQVVAQLTDTTPEVAYDVADKTTVTRVQVTTAIIQTPTKIIDADS